MPNMNDFFQLPGLEAIDYQVNSKLAKGLIDIFQEGIDYYAEAYSPSSSTFRGRNRTERMLQYCKQTMEPKLVKLVEQETGLLIDKVDWLGGLESPMVTGMFAMYITQDNSNDAIETIARETGVTQTPLGQLFFLADDESYNEMKLMAKKLDVHTGKLSGRRYGENNKRRIRGQLIFDVNCAFCIPEFIPDGIIEGNGMTAAEIAGIVCHEIGHAMTMVEHAGDMYRVMNRCRSAVNVVPSAEDIQKAGKESIITSIERGNALIDELKKRAATDLEPGELKSTLKALDTVQKAGENISSGIKTHVDDESNWWILGSLALFVFTVVYRIWLVSFVYVWMHIFHAFAGRSILKLCQSERTQLEKTKAGDTRITKNDQFLFERWADEFAARHGLGPALATGLNKIRTIMEYEMNTLHIPVFSTVLLHSTTFGFICKIYNKVFNFIEPASALDLFTYEFDNRRIKRIKENTYDFFKSAKDVSPAVKRKWIESVDKLGEEEDKAWKWQSSEFVQFALRNIAKFISPIEWATFIKNGRLSDDFMFLQNAIDAMRHNSMYYFAEKFDLKRYEKK